MFLLYYFFETYNTESVYKIYVDSDKYNINDGILVITRENIYFKIGTINDKNLHFVLYKNDELRFSGDSNSLLIDFYGYDQYFDTKTLKKDLDKYYIDIENNKYKLKFEKIYNNKNLIQETNDKISEETDNVKSNELYIPQKIIDLFKCDEMLCEYQDKKEKYVYVNGTNELTILKDDGYLIDDFKSNIISGTVDGKNIYIENGRIECNDDCDFQKKIYEKYYVKVKEKFWE